MARVKLSHGNKYLACIRFNIYENNLIRIYLTLYETEWSALTWFSPPVGEFTGFPLLPDPFYRLPANRQGIPDTFGRSLLRLEARHEGAGQDNDLALFRSTLLMESRLPIVCSADRDGNSAVKRSDEQFRF